MAHRENSEAGWNFYSHAREGRDQVPEEIPEEVDDFYSHAREGRDFTFFITIFR